MLSKTENKIEGERIVRRPLIKEGSISLVACSESGVENKFYTKKNKDLFKTAKKAKINQILK